MSPDRICAVPDCERPLYSRGWCRRHYDRWARHGDPLGGNHSPGQRPPCEAEGCERLADVKGLCRMHHHRWVASGDLRPSERWARATGLEERLVTKSHRLADGCLEWTGAKDGSGYGKLDYGSVQDKAHRWAYRLWVGPIPEGSFVLHLCDYKLCIEPSHLELGDWQKNNNDAWLRDRQPLSLTREQLLAIRERYAAGGITQEALAKEYGVAQTTISARLRYSILLDGPRPREESP